MTAAVLEGFTMRPMLRADVAVVAAIEAERHPVATWAASAFHDAIDAPDRYSCAVACLVAPADEVVAYGVVALSADTADLDNLTVRTDYERRGIGRWLLRALLDIAAERGASEILLEVRHDNAPAIALYASEGFHEIARRPDYYARGIDAIVMRRAVAGG